MITAAGTAHRLERRRQPRSRGGHRHPAEVMRSTHRSAARWAARVPEAILNHDPERERPSDFCAGCVE